MIRYKDNHCVCTRDNTIANLIRTSNGNTDIPNSHARPWSVHLPTDITCFQIALPGLQPPVAISLLEPLSQHALIIVRMLQYGTQLFLMVSHDTGPVRRDSCRFVLGRPLPGHDPTFPKKS